MERAWLETVGFENKPSGAALTLQWHIAHTGKTVQTIALIVAQPPAVSDALEALDQARASQAAAAAHPESAQARVARAAGAPPLAVGSLGPGPSPRSAADGASAGGGVCPPTSGGPCSQTRQGAITSRGAVYHISVFCWQSAPVLCLLEFKGF